MLGKTIKFKDFPVKLPEVQFVFIELAERTVDNLLFFFVVVVLSRFSSFRWQAREGRFQESV